MRAPGPGDLPAAEPAVASTDETVFSTRWFQVVARRHPTEGDAAGPYYALRMADYLGIIARNRAGDFLLVRQYRPAVERYTLELPAGHVDPGESPATAALRELEEETGFTTSRLESLGHLMPDTGRLSNTLWCFLANEATPLVPARPLEAGIELIVCSPAELAGKIRDGEFTHALHLAVLQLAIIAGKILDWPSPPL